jgi:hypothetical protein
MAIILQVIGMAATVYFFESAMIFFRQKKLKRFSIVQRVLKNAPHEYTLNTAMKVNFEDMTLQRTHSGPGIESVYFYKLRRAGIRRWEVLEDYSVSEIWSTNTDDYYNSTATLSARDRLECQLSAEPWTIVKTNEGKKEVFTRELNNRTSWQPLEPDFSAWVDQAFNSLLRAFPKMERYFIGQASRFNYNLDSNLEAIISDEVA